MARRRSLHCSISISKQVNSLSLLGKLIFTWGIAHQDDFGRLKADPEVLIGQIIPMMHTTKLLPTDRKSTTITADLIDLALKEMEEAKDNAGVPLIVVYEVCGEKYLQYIKSDDHQDGLHKRTKSKFPPPPPEKLNFPGNSGKFREIPSEGKGREEKGSEGKGTVVADAPPPATATDEHSLEKHPICIAYQTVWNGGNRLSLRNYQRVKAKLVETALEAHQLYPARFGTQEQADAAMQSWAENRYERWKSMNPAQSKPSLTWIIDDFKYHLDDLLREDAA